MTLELLFFAKLSKEAPKTFAMSARVNAVGFFDPPPSILAIVLWEVLVLEEGVVNNLLRSKSFFLLFPTFLYAYS